MASHLTGCLHYPASIILVSPAPNRKPIIRRGTQALLKYLITLMARRVVTRTKRTHLQRVASRVLILYCPRFWGIVLTGPPRRHRDRIAS